MVSRAKPNGVTIDTLMQHNDMSGSDLARKARLSRQYVSRIRRGERGASPAALRRLADALGVPVAAITIPPPAQKEATE